MLKLAGRSLFATHIPNMSKNRSGGIKQLRENNKEVHQYESTDMERCHVLILGKYFSKMPAEARKGDVFYLKPKVKRPTDPMEPWYQNVPLGKNTLATMMRKMAEKGHLDKKTNKSQPQSLHCEQNVQGKCPRESHHEQKWPPFCRRSTRICPNNR